MARPLPPLTGLAIGGGTASLTKDIGHMVLTNLLVCREEGLLCGGSSGASMACAVKVIYAGCLLSIIVCPNFIWTCENWTQYNFITYNKSDNVVVSDDWEKRNNTYIIYDDNFRLRRSWRPVRSAWWSYRTESGTRLTHLPMVESEVIANSHNYRC